MSCPDWTGLVALRERAAHAAMPPSPPAGRRRWRTSTPAPAAGGRPLAADPLLVFRRLPVTELRRPCEQAEAESMRQAVAAMRTARRLESRRSFAGWRRWAAAAVLTVASLAVGRDKAPRGSEPGGRRPWPPPRSRRLAEAPSPAGTGGPRTARRLRRPRLSDGRQGPHGVHDRGRQG